MTADELTARDGWQRIDEREWRYMGGNGAIRRIPGHAMYEARASYWGMTVVAVTLADAVAFVEMTT